MNIINELYDKSVHIAIWGCGYIGLTTAISYASQGIRSHAYDIDKKKIVNLQKGNNPIPNLDYWCGTDLRKIFKSNQILFTSNIADLENCTIHFIAVPTEKDMEPCFESLMQVLNDIVNISKRNNGTNYIIIESTLTPGTLEKTIVPFLYDQKINVGRDIILGIAPRRDWFISQDKNLKELPRVVATYNNQEIDVITNILSIICNNLVVSHDFKAAEMVKSVENTFRYVEITLANQLLLAYPDIDVDEVLRLCSTKWNMGTYFCSFGIGGYCVPLAAKYLIQGSDYNNALSIVKQAKEFNQNYPQYMYDFFELEKYNNIGILGLSYKENIKVCKGSPTISLCKLLSSLGKTVKINDPYYSYREIKKITGCNELKLDLINDELECIIVMVAHEEYKLFDIEQIVNNQKIKIVIDQPGIWNKYEWKNTSIKYQQVGKLML